MEELKKRPGYTTGLLHYDSYEVYFVFMRELLKEVVGALPFAEIFVETSISLVLPLIVLLLLFHRGDGWLRENAKTRLCNVLFDGRNWEESILTFFDSFTDLFDRLFRCKKVFVQSLGVEIAFPTFCRSVVSSSIALIMVFFVWWGHKNFLGGPQFFSTFGYWTPAFILAGLAINLVPDYISLCCTRFLMARVGNTLSHIGKLGWLLIDAVTNLFIMFASYSFFFLCAASLPLPILAVWINPYSIGVKVIWDAFIAGLTFSNAPCNPSPFWSIGAIYIWSNFLTSVWLWFYILGGIFSKMAIALDWFRRAIAHNTRAREYPVRIAAFGIIVAVLFFWGLIQCIPRYSFDVFVVPIDKESQQVANHIGKHLKHLDITVLVHQYGGTPVYEKQLSHITWIILVEPPMRIQIENDGFKDFKEWRNVPHNERQLLTINSTVSGWERNIETIRIWPPHIQPDSSQGLILTREFAELVKTELPKIMPIPLGINPYCEQRETRLKTEFQTLSLADRGLPYSCTKICAKNGKCGKGCEPTEAGCIASYNCAMKGFCAAYKDLCLLNNDGCMVSYKCAVKGHCTFKDKKCVATLIGCQRSYECTKYGKCGYNGEECVPNFEGCVLSDLCKLKGLCGFENGQCVATENGCSNSQNCYKNGICGLKGINCIVTAEGCKKSSTCKLDGKCGFVQDDCVKPFCAATPSGCAESKQCRKMGLCGFENGNCIINSKGCQSSEECRDFGKCKLRDKKCDYSEEGCARAKIGCINPVKCKNKGICDFVDGHEVATLDGCKSSIACDIHGKCGLGENRCIATEDGCGKSVKCRQNGKCTMRQGVCIATDSDCSKSERCATEGECVAVDGICLATEESCKRSNQCRTIGRCGYEKGKCLVSEDGCRQSLGCITHKLCSLSNGRCVNTK